MTRGTLLSIVLCTGVTAARATLAADEDGVAGLGNTDLGILIIAVAIALIATLLFRAPVSRAARQATRKIGQYRIRKVLQARSRNILEDFILPGAYGGLTHIDYAVLTSGGILCIQTKPYNGVVFGEGREPQWTNVDGTRRQKFLNPLIQNEGRAKALQKIVPAVPVASLVVFTGAVQFTSAREPNVVQLNELAHYIEKFEFGPCKVTDWDAVWMSIKAEALTDDESRKDFHAQLSFS